MQNWIGGSQYSPRGALYVPPPPEEVPALLTDLIAFSNRDDVEPVTQAAIAHAQFESIHPFTDGNGRIGRALIGAILRRRGVTPHTVLPVASVLAADTTHYFSLLTAYRTGDAVPIVTGLALCVETAVREARHCASVLPVRDRVAGAGITTRRQRRRPDPASPAVASGVHGRAAPRCP